MRMRCGVLVAVAFSLAGPAAAQVGAQRVRPTAFPLAVTPYLALGFGAARAAQADPLVCPTSDPNCYDNTVGSSPVLGIEVQAPLTRTLGVGITGAISRPARKLCVRGQCESGERITSVHGGVLLLWRFKPRAPIFFGIGPAVTFFTPGPVFGQVQSVTEPGGVGVVAYDAQVGARVGVRVAWWSYLTKPSDTDLTSLYTVSGLSYDKVFSFGIRYQP
jgi:hypothetical protein